MTYACAKSPGAPNLPDSSRQNDRAAEPQLDSCPGKSTSILDVGTIPVCVPELHGSMRYDLPDEVSDRQRGRETHDGTLANERCGCFDALIHRSPGLVDHSPRVVDVQLVKRGSDAARGRAVNICHAASEPI